MLTSMKSNEEKPIHWIMQMKPTKIKSLHTQIQRLKLCNSPEDIKKSLALKKT